jgi:large subunit ribosomal protein L10
MGVREEKELLVQEIADRLTRSKGTVITDYRGLNVAESTELRKQLREAGIEYRVLKNTLARRAASSIELEALTEYLAGPTAIAFSFDDPIRPAKILNDFARTHKALQLKGGVVEGRIVDALEVTALATLPSREGLLSMLLSVLQAPMRNMAYAVSQIAEKQGAEVAAE